MIKKVSISFNHQSSGYDINIGGGIVDNCGTWARNCLTNSSGKAAIVSNKKVFSIYGKFVQKSLFDAGFSPVVFLIGDGERYKDFRTLQSALNFLAENNITRTDAIIALGGGVVGDLAGFAASVYLRGLPLLQIPTTLLAMIDSSVGGKTAVNSAFGKNLIGTFYQPSGVLIDVDTLRTLPQREITAGFCEAVKQGAISGEPLLLQTESFLEKYPLRSFRARHADNIFQGEIVRFVAAQVSFKAEIVRDDERESAENTGARSRKILNFGHTLAHALEKTTNYRYLRHGEAVGYGIRFAAELSKNIGLLESKDVNLLNDVVHRAGKLPPIDHLDPELVFEALKYDKKIVDDSLQWILLKGIGKPVIVPHGEIPLSAILASFNSVIRS
ncbi:MAG: 3-dehydroquinate synthase [Saprospiraceae bacterium]|nr:3-dehydroquinate synthase [Pyrinomonadaceae bacterium]